MNYCAVNIEGEFELPLPALTPTLFNTHTLPSSTNPSIRSAVCDHGLHHHKNRSGTQEDKRSLWESYVYVSIFMTVSKSLPYAELLTEEIREIRAFAYYIEKMILCTCLKRITDIA